MLTAFEKETVVKEMKSNCDCTIFVFLSKIKSAHLILFKVYQRNKFRESHFSITISQIG